MITTGDLGFIHKYDFDNNIFKKIYTGAVSCGYIDFSLNRIFCYEHKETRFRASDILAYDTITGDTKEYPPYTSNNVAGQYIIFKQQDENNHLVIKAYDFLTEKGYTLLDINDIVEEDDVCGIYITPENIYLCVEKPVGFEIYVVLLQKGQVTIKKLASIYDE